jgi:transposase
LATESVEIKNRVFEAHWHENKQQFTEQSLRFIKKLIELEKSVLMKKLLLQKEVIQHLKNASKFFRVSVHEDILQLTRKTQIISEHVTRFGVTIMLTNRSKLKQEDILDLYRKKDHIEKIFDILKNEFDGKRLRSHSKETLDGRLFIKFIALI